MKTKSKLLCLSGTVALMSFLIPHAIADQWNKRTEFTFTGPVQIPGKTLPAGKYVFQLADSVSNRDIVQIFSEDPKGDLTLMATILAVPEYRQETPEKPLVNFEERPSGNPEAIASWFYPGENTGWEFIYRKQETTETSSAKSTKGT